MKAGKDRTRHYEDVVLERARLYQLVSDNVSDMVSRVDLQGVFSYVSPSHLRVLGFDPLDMLGMNAFDYVHPDDLPQVMETVRAGIASSSPIRMEYRSRHAGGYYIWTEAHANPLFDEKSAIAGAILVTRDITRRKEMEDALRKARDELEQKILERTAELSRVNRILTERQKDLESKNRELSELNSALRILLNQREKDKNNLEENIMANIKGLILPYVEKMKRGHLADRQGANLSVIEANLKEIVSSFSRQLSSTYTQLTPREIEVAHLVREGRDSKAIAGLLGLSVPTIEFHRNNLRDKLGLRNKKQNLRAFLLSLK
jgi:PAS domain S-box-containing protein